MSGVAARGMAASGIVTAAIAAPWLLGFSVSHAAVADHVAFAMSCAPLALVIAALRPAAALCMAGGGWLMASPWLLGYAGRGTMAWAPDLLLGTTLALLAARELMRR